MGGSGSFGGECCTETWTLADGDNSEGIGHVALVQPRVIPSSVPTNLDTGHLPKSLSRNERDALASLGLEGLRGGHGTAETVSRQHLSGGSQL